MLTDLHIKNFAIIDALHVVFRPGLNVLTGETGAGKSIIIDAVNLVLGGRASTELIRTGEEEATVEALFDLSLSDTLLASLSELGVECDGELLIKRVVSRSGRNRVFVGGGLSTISVLAEVARRLINIYGQHESQTLLRPENHLYLLDGFAGLLSLRAEFAVIFDDYRQIEADLKLLEEGERETERQLDLLSFQIQEIGAAVLVTGEEEDLERERQMLLHTEKLLMASQGAFESLYGGDDSILGQLQHVNVLICDAVAIDGSIVLVHDAIKGAIIQLEDAALQLRDYAVRVEADPVRLESVDDRIDLIGRLKKKYGNGIADILARKDEMQQELESLMNRERTREELDSRLVVLRVRLHAKGAELTASRQEGGLALKLAMEGELHDLAMKHAVFEVALDSLSEPRASGMEVACFFFSPNPGESPKSMARIASGGELSRIMLALKQVHPESDVPTLVFDEVDTGIGGSTSALVGEKLKRVAQKQQVLCITHLPQVAAFADHHFRVEKRIVDGRTVTMVSPLDCELRVAEMARMLGGSRVTEKTLEHAKEMVDEAKG